MLNSNFRFPLPSSFFLDRYRCFLNLFLLVEGVFSSFFLKLSFINSHLCCLSFFPSLSVIITYYWSRPGPARPCATTWRASGRSGARARTPGSSTRSTCQAAHPRLVCLLLVLCGGSLFLDVQNLSKSPHSLTDLTDALTDWLTDVALRIFRRFSPKNWCIVWFSRPLNPSGWHFKY